LEIGQEILLLLELSTCQEIKIVQFLRLLNLLLSFYRLQGWLVGSQIQVKRGFRKQARLDLVLFLVQMASSSEPAVLRLFDWWIYLMRLNLRANQNYYNRSLKMVNWTIWEPYLYPSGEYDHYFCSSKLVLVALICVSASVSKSTHLK
jgi:hypothetical protein